MNWKLLAVEDNKGIADIISNVGVLAGYETCIAISDQEFKKAYDNFSPNVIVLDILMPGMDGFDILRFLKDHASQSHIVILSGDNSFRKMAEDIGNVYGLSIDANVSKPFRVVELRNILENVKLKLAA